MGGVCAVMCYLMYHSGYNKCDYWPRISITLLTAGAKQFNTSVNVHHTHAAVNYPFQSPRKRYDLQQEKERFRSRVIYSPVTQRNQMDLFLTTLSAGSGPLTWVDALFQHKWGCICGPFYGVWVFPYVRKTEEKRNFWVAGLREKVLSLELLKPFKLSGFISKTF